VGLGEREAKAGCYWLRPTHDTEREPLPQHIHIHAGSSLGVHGRWVGQGEREAEGHLTEEIALAAVLLFLDLDVL
jgi:hypothetical protein